jgi:hypothetical protein
MIIVGLVIVSIHPVGRYQRLQCAEKLKALGYAIRVYQTGHGHLPRQLSVLSNDLLSPSLLICPGSGHAPGSFQNANTWTDYEFMDWALFLGTNTVPGGYPIAYDRSIRSHVGRGVNVVNVNGLVRWDPAAQSLIAFAAEHPEVKLRIPE